VKNAIIISAGFAEMGEEGRALQDRGPAPTGRGARPALDRAELAEILLRVSALVERVQEIEELDLNPLVITEAGLLAIDARVVVHGR
jgi:acyl-CoA synthetase (NDP forming)